VTDAILAIDQGTTGTRALVYDQASGAIRSSAYEELPQHFPRPGWVEHDPDDIWAGVTRTIERALQASGGARVRAIGVTNQRETVVVWDRASGRPIHRAIVWQDRRTAAACAALKDRGQERAVRRATGLVLDPYFSATKLAWILAHDRVARRLARTGRLAAGTIDTWVLWNLTGGRAHATDPTNASRTLLYDIDRRAWSARLATLFDVPLALLPDVRPSAAPFGETARRPGGLPDGVPITGVAGDQQAALFGHGCTSKGQAKNTYGTGCFFVVNAGQSRPRTPRGLLTTLACDARGRACYAIEGSVFIAGAAIQWLRDGLQIIASAAETEALARSVADTGGVAVVPAFAGLGAPHWDPHARGVIVGLTRGTTRAHIVRATLESLALQAADVVRLACAAPGVRVRELRVDGGASANGFLLQCQADVLGVPVSRPISTETTALGAALLAGAGAGFTTALDPLRALASPALVVRPGIRPAQRRALLHRWEAAVRQARSHRPAP
jgi:glycerol kinase